VALGFFLLVGQSSFADEWPPVLYPNGSKTADWYASEDTVTKQEGDWVLSEWGPKEGILQIQQRAKYRMVTETTTSQRYHYAQYVRFFNMHYITTRPKHKDGNPQVVSIKTYPEESYEYSMFDPPSVLPVIHYYVDPVAIPVPGNLLICTSWVQNTPDINGRMPQTYLWCLDGSPIPDDMWHPLSVMGPGTHELYLYVIFADGSEDEWFFYFNVGTLLTLSSNSPDRVRVPLGRIHTITLNIANTTNRVLPVELTPQKISGPGEWEFYYPDHKNLLVQPNTNVNASIVISSTSDIKPGSRVLVSFTGDTFGWKSNSIELEIQINGQHRGEIQSELSKNKKKK
jgi:hypothetical protein